jgi:uncharacterized protein
MLTALLLGVVGSLHCAGMCGPIALALPLSGKTIASRATGIVLYNSGRALTYSVLGAISGLAGGTLMWAGGQQLLSVTAGAIILLVLAAGLAGKRMRLPGPVDRMYTGIRGQLGKLFRRRKPGTLLLIGLLNGLLPCGLVYAALGGAAATGSMLQGALFMLLFGMGTSSALAALSSFGAYLNVTFRQKLRKAVPVVVGVMATLLILRGLGLGIPYVSPSFATEKPVCCHRH